LAETVSKRRWFVVSLILDLLQSRSTLSPPLFRARRSHDSVAENLSLRSLRGGEDNTLPYIFRLDNWIRCYLAIALCLDLQRTTSSQSLASAEVGASTNCDSQRQRFTSSTSIDRVRRMRLLFPRQPFSHRLIKVDFHRSKAKVLLRGHVVHAKNRNWI